jgi:hypothetical protein
VIVIVWYDIFQFFNVLFYKREKLLCVSVSSILFYAQ